MVVTRRRHAQPQQILIIVDRLDNRYQEQQELRILIRRLARTQQVYPGVGGKGPVVVLAAAVDPCKGLLVQQADQAVPARHLLHDLHGQLIMVGGNVPRGIDRGKLMLAGSNLVVLGFCIDAQLPEFFVEFFHIGLDPRLDSAEIVVVQLLALRRFRTEQCPAGVNQVLALQVHVTVDQEVFLLGADIGDHTLHFGMAEEIQNPQRLAVQRLHAAQQGRLLVKGLSAV